MNKEDLMILEYLSKRRESLIIKIKIALRKSIHEMDDDEIINECFIASKYLLKKFDKNKSKLSTYLNRYLLFVVQREMFPRYNSSMIRTPVCWIQKKYRPKECIKYLDGTLPMYYNEGTSDEWNIIDKYCYDNIKESKVELGLTLDRIKKLVTEKKIRKEKAEALLLSSLGYTQKEIAKKYNRCFQLMQQWIESARERIKNYERHS